MSWPIGTPVSRASRALHDDVADMARKSGSLERENANLRAEVKDLRAALDTLRVAHANATTKLIQTEVILTQLTIDAVRSPLWGISRWVQYGPVADEIQRWEKQS